jgi:hypothetical protein
LGYFSVGPSPLNLVNLNLGVKLATERAVAYRLLYEAAATP